MFLAQTGKKGAGDIVGSNQKCCKSNSIPLILAVDLENNNVSTAC